MNKLIQIINKMFEFEAIVFPYLSYEDKQLEKDYSSRIEVSADLVNTFPFELFSDLPIFRVFKINEENETRFIVSFGGVSDLVEKTIKMPRWCMKHLGIRPLTKCRFQHVEHIEQANFVKIFPSSIDFKRTMPDEEQRFAFLQNKLKNYLIIQTNTQITLHDSQNDTHHQFLIGDIFDPNGEQIMIGRTLDCDLTIDLQFPTDPEEEKLLKIEHEKSKKTKKYQHAIKMYNLFKKGRLFGYSAVPKHPDVCICKRKIINGVLI